MILEGTIFQSGEPMGFAGVYYSEQDGTPIESGEKTEADVDGFYSIDLSRYESSTRTGMSYNGYLTFQGVGDKKTYAISDLACKYDYDPVSLPEASRTCVSDIDLDANYIEEFTTIYIPSFWEKYKYAIIVTGLILSLFIGFKLIKK
jgi:hypothetical protein